MREEIWGEEQAQRELGGGQRGGKSVRCSRAGDVLGGSFRISHGIGLDGNRPRLVCAVA